MGKPIVVGFNGSAGSEAAVAWHGPTPDWREAPVRRGGFSRLPTDGRMMPWTPSSISSLTSGGSSFP